MFGDGDELEIIARQNVGGRRNSNPLAVAFGFVATGISTSMINMFIKIGMTVIGYIANKFLSHCGWQLFLLLYDMEKKFS